MGVTSIRLQPEIENPLEKLAIKLDRSKNHLINQAIKEFLERKSLDEKRWDETLEAIDSVKSNNLVDEKEVNAWLESWGKEDELIEALAIVHIEYILVHPFREGNGRLSRLLAIIMALQSGEPILDFTYMDENKNDYFAAIQTGLDDARAMQGMFRQVLLESQQNATG